MKHVKIDDRERPRDSRSSRRPATATSTSSKMKTTHLKLLIECRIVLQLTQEIQWGSTPEKLRLQYMVNHLSKIQLPEAKLAI